MKNDVFQERVLVTLSHLRERQELQHSDIKEIKAILDDHLPRSAVIKWMTAMLIAWCAAISGVLIKMMLR